MSIQVNGQLSRDEQALLEFYRQLPAEKQFEILEKAEYEANAIHRMQELAGRLIETGQSESDLTRA